MNVEFVSAGVGILSAARPWYKSSKVSTISRQMSFSPSTVVSVLPREIDASKWRVGGSLMTGVTAGPGGGISIARLSGRKMSVGVTPGDVIGHRCVVVTDVGAWAGASAS